MITYNKEYSSIEEYNYRYDIFVENYNYIQSHNSQNRTYTLSLNKFADLSYDEYQRYSNIQETSFPEFPKKESNQFKTVTPSSLDWRNSGIVTPVKNQGQCGSCWAFSATGSLESAFALKTNVLTSLSEEELVDCSYSEGDDGCIGGLMDNAFKYVMSNGLTSEDDYPYASMFGTNNTCNSSYPRVLPPILGYVDVSPDEESLLQAVTLQPVSVAIEADQPSFQFYTSGVLSDSGCGERLDHGVLVVGYGTDTVTGLDYWIVKNSWGEDWGESGYVRIVRGSNECGISNMASYPVIS
jgi:C1A family cysteine protease